MSPPTAALRGVSRLFPGGNGGLAETSLDIAPGEMLALLGPSGCGKSTLLRLLAGLDRPDTGEISLGGPATLVQQDASLLPWLNVRDNAALLLRLQGRERPAREAEAATWLERLGLADKALQHPWQLSGGERMRVSLARALGLRPALFLFDEPFAALDEMTREKLQEDLRALQRREGWAGVFVTHSVSEAVFLADRIAVMGGRPGRITRTLNSSLPKERGPETRATTAFAEAMGGTRATLREA